jgi:hypothetical protein
VFRYLPERPHGTMLYKLFRFPLSDMKKSGILAL